MALMTTATCLQLILAPGLLISYFCHHLAVLSLSFLHFSLSYSSTESPLLWIRADPDMEYLAEVHFNQPVQMWVRMWLWFTNQSWRGQLIFWSIVALHFTWLSVLRLVLKFLIYLHYFSCLNIWFYVEVHQMRTKILVSNLCLTCHLIIKTELKELRWKLLFELRNFVYSVWLIYIYIYIYISVSVGVPCKKGPSTVGEDFFFFVWF